MVAQIKEVVLESQVAPQTLRAPSLRLFSGAGMGNHEPQQPGLAPYRIPSTLSRTSPPASTPMGEIATSANWYQIGCFPRDCSALSAASARTTIPSASTWISGFAPAAH